MTEDDIPEDVARGVEKALFGERSGAPVVAIKRPHRLKGSSERERQELREAQMRTYAVSRRGGA